MKSSVEFLAGQFDMVLYTSTFETCLKDAKATASQESISGNRGQRQCIVISNAHQSY
jgi:hypothetical protein